jgi:hypothetical protein
MLECPLMMIWKMRRVLSQGLVLAGWVALALGMGACAWFNPPVETGGVLFQDEFDHPLSGWDRYEDGAYAADYQAGVYRIAVFQPNTEVWARPHLTLDDARIYVAATHVDGPDDNLFGIICRYQDPKNFYFFVASNDGYGGIGMYQDGEAVLFGEGRLLPSDAIRPGGQTNHLEAACIGEELTLSVNGEPLASADSALWTQGDVGLIVGTYSDAPVEFHFDNYSVRVP